MLGVCDGMRWESGVMVKPARIQDAVRSFEPCFGSS